MELPDTVRGRPNTARHVAVGTSGQARKAARVLVAVGCEHVDDPDARRDVARHVATALGLVDDPLSLPPRPGVGGAERRRYERRVAAILAARTTPAPTQETPR